MNRTILILALTMTFVSTAFAHGSEQHIMGTVTAINADSITVQTTQNEKVVVTVDSSTKFVKSGSPAKANDLTVGDRVVVGAEKDGAKLHAHSVKFGKERGKTPKTDHSTMKMGDMKH